MKKSPLPRAWQPGATDRPVRLRYVSIASPGWVRRHRRTGFAYFRGDGSPVKNPADVQRINRLAIPPAWTDVWICPSANGHIQATGRDARGRLQYRYHPEWRAARDATKFDRMLEFARVLPAIRRRVARDSRQPPVSREAVLATVVRLLESTLIRVGNEEYARANGSYGLTTLRDRHLDVRGSQARFHFSGKSGQYHNIALQDRALARRLRVLQDLPGQELFQYVDAAGRRHPITSSDVNDYPHQIAGEQFSAKDFRTWAGTLAAADALSRVAARNGRYTKRQLGAVVTEVANRLGNTPSICRRCYIHPAVLAPGAAFVPLPSSRGSRAIAGRAAEKRLIDFLSRQQKTRRKSSTVAESKKPNPLARRAIPHTATHTPVKLLRGDSLTRRAARRRAASNPRER
jgi:DNA topoisomerase I